ncbi:MAG: phosphoadenylyl-sulfate reductase [Ilumatobacter sp.]
METRPFESRIEVDVLAATATAAIEWAWSTYPGQVCVLTSMQDAVVIDLALRVDRQIPIVFLDTGYHFDETHETVRRVEQRYRIEVERTRAPGPFPEQIESGACCDVKPLLLERALRGRQGWITGIQRTATAERSNAALIDADRRGAVKVAPLAQWSDDDRQRYISHHDVITNPLLDQGFGSIGCRTCTSPSSGPNRSGRWAGSERTECGLHV